MIWKPRLMSLALRKLIQEASLQSPCFHRMMTRDFLQVRRTSMRALACTLSLNVPPVSTGTDKSCKLWTHWGVLLNVVPLSRAIANGAGHVVAMHRKVAHAKCSGGLMFSPRAFIICCCDGSVSTLTHEAFKVLNRSSLNSGSMMRLLFFLNFPA